VAEEVQRRAVAESLLESKNGEVLVRRSIGFNNSNYNVY
jgi:hypothetical protein